MCSVHTYYICYTADGLFWLNLYIHKASIGQVVAILLERLPSSSLSVIRVMMIPETFYFAGHSVTGDFFPTVQKTAAVYTKILFENTNFLIRKKVKTTKP